MKSRSFSAMGTTWWLGGEGDLAAGEVLVRSMEARLSRFLPDSALSQLNRARVVEDAVLAEVVRVALQFHLSTDGAFDPRLGAELCALGYDRPFAEVGGSGVMPRRKGLWVGVDADRVWLEGDGTLDLGGIAKGWTVDRVFEALEGERLVDGGGDMRAVGPGWTIGVGDEHHIELDGAAVATSSVRVRRWQLADGTEVHHLLDPRTARPVRGPLTEATVLAQNATTADVLAKAVLIDPDSTLPLLSNFGARALVCDRAGRWWNSAEPLVAA